MDPQKRKAFITEDMTIRKTMRAIDDAGLGIALIVDGPGRLLGTVTDGDIRRAILAGKDLESPIREIMNRTPVVVTPESDMQSVRRVFLDSTLKHIPVADEKGNIVDLLLVSELLAVPLSTPDITAKEIEAVLGVLRTPHLSLGPKVYEFEEKIASYAKRRYAVAVNSGTSGLHLVVRALGLGKGDEVITTPFSFIASSNCLLYEDVTPVFVDIDERTYNMDPHQVEAAITPRTRAILAVDVFGQPARYDLITELTERHGLALIVDSCESIGAEFMGRRASTFGVASVFAFYPNKQITTGEGGAIVTDSDHLAALCRSMRNQGRTEGGGWLCHERLGYNYRLPDISCALGIVQLERIDEILKMRQNVADMYYEALAGIEGIHLPFVDPRTSRMSWFVYVIRLADEYSRQDRDGVLQRMRAAGIGVNNYFPPIHLQPFYREQFGFQEGDYPVTERVSARTIALPFHNKMTHEDCRWIAQRLKSALEESGVLIASHWKG